MVCRDMAYSTGLLIISLEETPSWPSLLRAAAHQVASRLYVLWHGGCADEIPGPELLKILTRSYDAIAKQTPTLDLIPLCSTKGWTLQKAAAITDIDVVFETCCNSAPPDGDKSDKSASDFSVSAMLAAREAAGLSRVGVAEVAAEVAALEDDKCQNDQTEVPAPPACEYVDSLPNALQFQCSAVGGTFDHLHAGHRLLLSVTALCSTKKLFVGLASDQLLANKKHAQFLMPYDDRSKQVEEFLTTVNPTLEVHIGALQSGDPPLAATVSEFDGLIISRETIQGGESIQSHRASQGFDPLTIVAVDLVGAESQAPDADKLSSTAIRRAKEENTTAGQ